MAKLHSRQRVTQFDSSYISSGCLTRGWIWCTVKSSYVCWCNFIKQRWHSPPSLKMIFFLKERHLWEVKAFSVTVWFWRAIFALRLSLFRLTGQSCVFLSTIIVQWGQMDKSLPDCVFFKFITVHFKQTATIRAHHVIVFFVYFNWSRTWRTTLCHAKNSSLVCYLQPR